VHPLSGMSIGMTPQLAGRRRSHKPQVVPIWQQRPGRRKDSGDSDQCVVFRKSCGRLARPQVARTLPTLGGVEPVIQSHTDQMECLAELGRAQEHTLAEQAPTFWA
jgi:hypothetical protein